MRYTSSRFFDNFKKLKKENTIEDFKKIRNFKSQRCDQRYEDLEPWDETYFTGMMKSFAYNLDSTSLFGATFHSIPLAPHESWYEDVLKMSLHHPDPEEGDLGYLYLDLNSRKGKYPGCANFAIKGGRRLSETKY
ncbi:hypothetical protein GIB67_001429 [Kingdonia uniflora]|uniref:Peptidase M3A/M3B catalytic domain-containing protein n=1 Tax=Kingdonia uniflora TaxID=39325 RepID=A0A7J7L6V5_9MAGN|nr:hypothetical protein GIB67_001429 [Kingdonia uniflora]